MPDDRITVQPGQVINRATGEVGSFQTMPISPTERITPDDRRWPEAVNQNCGNEARTFVKQPDGTYQPEAQ